MKRSAPPTSILERLAALGDMTRLRILRLLESHELSVGEVSQVVQLPQSTVSRHLKVLADGSWLAKRNQGTATLYRHVLDDVPVEARALWVAVRDQLGHSAEFEDDARRVKAVLAERRTDSQAFFGQVAGEWDRVRSELFGSRFTQDGLLAFLPRHWVVADLGCGTGNASELLAPCVKRVIAVDQSAAMLDAAKRRLEGVRNVEFVRGELEKLPLEDASVDAAVIALVLHHAEEPGAALGEARRVLRAGGTLLVIDMTAHDRAEYRRQMGHRHLGFERSVFEAMLRSAGFTDVAVRDLPGEPEARGPGLFVATARAPEMGDNTKIKSASDRHN